MNQELDEAAQPAESATNPVQTGLAASKPTDSKYPTDSIDPEDILPSLY